MRRYNSHNEGHKRNVAHINHHLKELCKENNIFLIKRNKTFHLAALLRRVDYMRERNIASGHTLTQQQSIIFV